MIEAFNNWQHSSLYFVKINDHAVGIDCSAALYSDLIIVAMHSCALVTWNRQIMRCTKIEVLEYCCFHVFRFAVEEIAIAARYPVLALDVRCPMCCPPIRNIYSLQAG